MNNIEILEKLLKQYEKFNESYGMNGYVIDRKEIRAIKNIIQENKELKTKLQEHICIEAHDQVKQLYIPKSKVKELAKKYEFAINDYDSSTADYKHSQNLGKYLACIELLKGEE